MGSDGARTAAALANLRGDALTANVVRELGAAGVRALLLKGPAVARWLYDAPGERAYVDSDLLVAPGDLAAAERVLRAQGFRPGEWQAWLRHARPWTGARGTVDLHTSLFGITVGREHAWETLARSTERLVVAGGEVEVLAPAARALHVAMHVAQHPRSHAHGGSRRDLERALARVPRTTWDDAALLARELGAEAALASGLRRVEGGDTLADALGLGHADSPEVALFAEDASPEALWFAEMAAADSTRLRLALAARAIVPPPALMRTWSPLAARSDAGLALAYVTRAVRLARSAPAGFAAWRRARR